MDTAPFTLEITQDAPAVFHAPTCSGSLDLRLADCMDVMKGFEDGHFDLAVVDPPYGIGAGGSFGRYWDSTLGKPAPAAVRNIVKDWDKAIPGADYWRELFRVSKHQIVWGGNYFTEYLPPRRGWIGWDKKQPEAASFGMLEMAWSSFDRPTKMFRMYSTHVTQGVRIHPTQKPIDLYKWIFSKYAAPGQRVLDTHMGSGSVAIAAHYAGIHLTACEIDADYYEAAMARITKETRQAELFSHLNDRDHAAGRETPT